VSAKRKSRKKGLNQPSERRQVEVTQAGSTRQAALLAVLVAAVAVIVLAVYWPALSAESKWLDDGEYLTGIRSLQGAPLVAVKRLFGEPLEPSTVRGYYQPLAMVSLMVDGATGGDAGNLRPFRRTNLCLHVLNTALLTVVLFLLFRRLGVAAILGLLFGIHPLTVEPVVWLAERKTLLATFLALGSLACYVCYARKWSRIIYGASAATYVLALLSKPTVVPLPGLMLLLDYWPNRRLSRRAVLEKVPLFLVGGVSSIVTIISQGRTIAVTTPGEYPLIRIPLLLCHNIVFYLGKIVWPTSLSSWYTFPEPLALSHPSVLAGVIGTGILIAALLVSWRWTRALVTGWLFFFLAGLPTMGIIGFHPVIAADRHVYLPLIGLLLPGAWFVGRLWKTSRPQVANLLRRLGIVIFVVLVTCTEAALTRGYLVHWKDTTSLYRYMLNLTPDVSVLHYGLGRHLQTKGRVQEALVHYREAVEFMRNTRYDRNLVSAAHNNIAGLLTQEGRVEEALSHYRQALRLTPNRPAVVNNLVWLLATHQDSRIRDAAEAVRLAEQTCEAAGPQEASTMLLDTLAAAYAEAGRFEDAVHTVREAISRAVAAQSPAYVRDLEGRLRLYQMGRPYRQVR